MLSGSLPCPKYTIRTVQSTAHIQNSPFRFFLVNVLSGTKAIGKGGCRLLEAFTGETPSRRRSCFHKSKNRNKRRIDVNTQGHKVHLRIEHGCVTSLGRQFPWIGTGRCIFDFYVILIVLRHSDCVYDNRVNNDTIIVFSFREGPRSSHETVRLRFLPFISHCLL